MAEWRIWVSSRPREEGGSRTVAVRTIVDGIFIGKVGTISATDSQYQILRNKRHKQKKVEIIRHLLRG